MTLSIAQHLASYSLCLEQTFEETTWLSSWVEKCPIETTTSSLPLIRLVNGDLDVVIILF
jgi:hypothetical protein